MQICTVLRLPGSRTWSQICDQVPKRLKIEGLTSSQICNEVLGAKLQVVFAAKREFGAGPPASRTDPVWLVSELAPCAR